MVADPGYDDDHDCMNQASKRDFSLYVLYEDTGKHPKRKVELTLVDFSIN